MAASHTPSRGYVFDVLLRVVLLLLVLGQVTYLAGRYSLRKDFTTDRLYSLSASTQKVLSGLDDRFVIEAYFSSDDKLPSVYRNLRLELRNFLDEYVRMSKGRIVVQYFDPLSDNEIKKKAERLQIRPITANDQGESSLAFTEVWQGLRFRYRDEKQKVIPLMQFQGATSMYEAAITPIIKELTVREKPVIGFLAFATEAGGGGNMPWQQQRGGQPKGFEKLKELNKGRYELKDLDLNEGKLVPDEMKSVIVVRPKKLTDRQKYALDQFLMRGGKLVVFADTNEYDPGGQRTFTGTPVPFDAPDATLRFRDQLAHYGVRVEDKLLADMFSQAWAPFVRYTQTWLGMQPTQVPYPYWFHAVALDWSQLARDLARNELRGGHSNGSVGELEEQYRKSFKPGVVKTETLLQFVNDNERGPAVFWPCPVLPSDKLPEGVTADVLMRTSPLAFTKDPPHELDPIGAYEQDERQRQGKINLFVRELQTTLKAAPRRQYPLVVLAKGTFGSFFEGKPVPPRKPPEKKAETPKDPLTDPIQQDPLASSQPSDVAATQPTTQPTMQPATQPAGDAATQPASQPDVGPPSPPPAAADAKPEEKDPEPVFKGKPASLLVIGDSDFVRDDILMGEHQQQGGPFSQAGALFFASMLDWLAEDQDLLALRSKQVQPRLLSFVKRDMLSEETPEAYAERVKSTRETVRLVNVVLPPALLLVVGILVAIRRRTQKQTFLASVQD